MQGVALMKLYFHPGTDMAQAMAETVGYVNRSRAFMPYGTVQPFIMRFDTGSVPVGYLVLRFTPISTHSVPFCTDVTAMIHRLSVMQEATTDQAAKLRTARLYAACCCSTT